MKHSQTYARDALTGFSAGVNLSLAGWADPRMIVLSTGLPPLALLGRATTAGGAVTTTDESKGTPFFPLVEHLLAALFDSARAHDDALALMLALRWQSCPLVQPARALVVIVSDSLS